MRSIKIKDHNMLVLLKSIIYVFIAFMVSFILYNLEPRYKIFAVVQAICIILFTGTIIFFSINKIDHGSDPDDDEVQTKEKINYLRTFLKNLKVLKNFYNEHKEFNCKITCKNGDIVVGEVKTREYAYEYQKWFLNAEGKSTDINFAVSDSEFSKISISEVRSFEIIEKSLIQDILLIPVKSLFSQSAPLFVSYRMLMALFIVISLSIALYGSLVMNMLFQGPGSIKLYTAAVDSSVNIIKTVLIICLFITSFLAVFRLKEAISKYYTGVKIDAKNTFGFQLFKLIAIPILFSGYIQPFFKICLQIAQNNGYFLP